MRRFMAAMLIVGSLALSARAAEPAPELATVRTLADLEALEAHDAGHGWRVRVGASDGGADAGPWVTLHCLAEHDGPEEKPAWKINGLIPGEVLGPVFYRADWDGAKGLAQQLAMWGRWPGRRVLSSEVVPLAWEGRAVVSVLTREGKVLGTRAYDLREARPCWWSGFAWGMWNRGRNERGLYVVRDEAHAVYPLYSRFAIPDPRAGEAAAPAPLPGGDGEGVPDGLKLTFEDGEFIVRAEREMTDWPDGYLTARWWVNGRPVLPPRPKRTLQQAVGRRVSSTHEMRVEFGLPDHLPVTNSGDRVSLQLLYAPKGLAALPETRQATQLFHLASGHSDASPLPLLSNRLEFELTDELLRRKDNPVR